MEIKNLIVIFLILFQNNLIESNETSKFENCRLKNLEYNNEYLYASSNGNVFTYPLNKVKDQQKLNWTFLSIAKINKKIGNLLNNQYFFIKSHSNKGEYLCGSKTQDRTHLSKQLIKLVKLNPENLNLNCFWIFENINPSKDKMSNKTYMIKNAILNEPIFPALFFFKSGWNKRNVYLWVPKKGMNLPKFKWDIECTLN